MFHIVHIMTLYFGRKRPAQFMPFSFALSKTGGGLSPRETPGRITVVKNDTSGAPHALRRLAPQTPQSSFTVVTIGHFIAQGVLSNQNLLYVRGAFACEH